MEETTALATAGPSLNEQIELAKALAPSDIIPAAYRGKPANIVVAMEFGQSMGLSPAESLYRINVIQGKPTMSAELVAAQVRKAGHKLRIEKDEQHTSVTCTIVRSDDPKYPFRVTRDAEWAKQMGLTNKDNYRKQPLTMLTWRAITACAREACPEALFGVAYTPDEMRDMDASATPVAAEVSVEPGATTDFTQTRMAYAEYRRATGESNEQAMADVCAAVGSPDMQSMTQAQADAATEWLASHSNRRDDVSPGGASDAAKPDGQDATEPDVSDVDYEF